MMEFIAIASSVMALVISIGAIVLDVKIMRELHPHHHMIRELHHHHIAAPSQTSVESPYNYPGLDPEIQRQNNEASAAQLEANAYWAAMERYEQMDGDDE